jgi:uncharacterized protein YciI
VDELHLLVVKHLKHPDEVERHAAGHIAYLKKYHAEGTFIASGQTVNPEEGGAIIAAGVGREELEKIIAEDVFLQRGLSSYEIVSINVRRSHPVVAELLEQLRPDTAEH